ncbi:MAG: hypothetical protein AAF211_04560 [Myxococcota bacterium]
MDPIDDDAVREAILPALGGHLEVRVDADAETVSILCVPTPFDAQGRRRARRLRHVGLAGLGLVAVVGGAAVVPTVWLPLVGMAALFGLGILEATFAFWDAPPTGGSPEPIHVSIDRRAREVRVGRTRLRLRITATRWSDPVWELHGVPRRASIGTLWHAGSIHWLESTLGAVRDGRFHDIPLDPIPGPLPVPLVDERPAHFVVDASGVDARVEPLGFAKRWTHVLLASQTPMVWLQVAYLWIILDDLRLRAGAFVIALGLTVWTIIGGLAARRRHHPRVHIDERHVHFVEGATARRVALADVVRAYQRWGTGPIQLDLRGDLGSLTLGHGWDLESCRRLFEHLTDALGRVRPSGEPLPTVPAGLRQLRQATQVGRG